MKRAKDLRTNKVQESKAPSAYLPALGGLADKNAASAEERVAGVARADGDAALIAADVETTAQEPA